MSFHLYAERCKTPRDTTDYVDPICRARRGSHRLPVTGIVNLHFILVWPASARCSYHALGSSHERPGEGCAAPFAACISGHSTWGPRATQVARATAVVHSILVPPRSQHVAFMLRPSSTAVHALSVRNKPSRRIPVGKEHLLEWGLQDADEWEICLGMGLSVVEHRQRDSRCGTVVIVLEASICLRAARSKSLHGFRRWRKTL